MILIAASILSADFSRLREQVQDAEAGGADWIHFDVMDGAFVPNITFGPIVAAGVRKITRLPLDAHLMVRDADSQIEHFKEAGIDRLTVHVEACPHLWSTLEKIKSHGLYAGVTLNPATPLSLVEPVLSLVDLLLIMTVEPGMGGQKLIPMTLNKIAEAAEYRRRHGLSFLIQADGGIDETTAPLVVEAGADCLVAGTAVFAHENVREAVKNLRRAAENASKSSNNV
ncbi:MAG: ribulose-phosphate 3-epimerase [candidate division KSB1 bacterium]|nr:ribulose-phosphate 3-epimerase [candidate division KSB1 bacterium]